MDKIRIWIPRFRAWLPGEARSRSYQAILWILLLAFALRTACLTRDRFHADEALYAGWALRILDDDPWLLDEPIDKPPLFLYALAGALRLFGRSEVAARWVNLACSMVSIALLYRLAACLFPDDQNNAPGWAALFLACSPFDILFARTAFTDPMLMMWWLAALLAAARGQWLWSGLLGGLAFATKQHAVVLLPLLPLIGLLSAAQPRRRWAVLALGPGFLLPWGLVLGWDSLRWAVRPGYWDQSVLSYGGLTWAVLAAWPARFFEWLGWARYLTGGGALGLMWLTGLPALFRHKARSAWRWAGLWLAFIFAYLVFHTIFNFSVWDRYLLPLAVPVALLGAWMVRWIVRRRKMARFLAAAVALAVGLRAAVNGYPLGGEHWAYQGIDRIAAYLKANAAPDAVLYHHWLRWHYTYYLHGRSFELRWWQDGEHLRREAIRTDPAREQYIVLPDWRTLDPTVDGVRFVPILRAERLLLCRVEVDP